MVPQRETELRTVTIAAKIRATGPDQSHSSGVTRADYRHSCLLPARAGRRTTSLATFPRATTLHLIPVVGREHHCHPQCRQALDDLPRVVTRGGIEPGGRLVEEQQFRIRDQRDRDVQPPLLAAGKLGNSHRALLFQTDQLDHFIHRPRMRVEGQIHGDRLAHGEISVHPVDCKTIPPRAFSFARS